MTQYKLPTQLKTQRRVASRKSTTGFTPTLNCLKRFAQRRCVLLGTWSIFNKERKQKRKMNFSSNKLVSGFTLIETLVGIFVIVTALTAAFTAAHTSLKSAQRARDQVTAFYLTQEGYELIKNVRDSNVQERDPSSDYWMNGLTQCIGNPCRISAFNGSNKVKDTITTSDAEAKFLQSDVTKEFRYDGSGIETRFSRSFTVTLAAPNEIRVDMTVEWTHGNANLSFETSEYISNWRF